MISKILALMTIAGSALFAADDIDRQEQTARELSTLYDKPQSVGYTTTLIVARQEGNKFPAIWAGRWGKGDFKIHAEYDMLDDALLLKASGSILVHVAAVPDRVGLEELFPLQALVGDLRKQPLSIIIRDFTEISLLTDKDVHPFGKKPPEGRLLMAKASAVVRSGETETVFPGQTVYFVHDAKDLGLHLRCELVLDGSRLPLPKTQHTPIKLSLNVKGPAPSLDALPGPGPKK